MDDEVRVEISNIEGRLLVLKTILSRMSGMLLSSYSCLSTCSLPTLSPSGKDSHNFPGGLRLPATMSDHAELELLDIATRLANLNIVYSGEGHNTSTSSTSMSNMPSKSPGSLVGPNILLEEGKGLGTASSKSSDIDKTHHSGIIPSILAATNASAIELPMAAKSGTVFAWSHQLCQISAGLTIACFIVQPFPLEVRNSLTRMRATSFSLCLTYRPTNTRH